MARYKQVFRGMKLIPLSLEDQIQPGTFPVGHFKFLHLWPVKFPQARQLDYRSFSGFCDNSRGGFFQPVAAAFEFQHR
jgi:hypothetical protein